MYPDYYYSLYLALCFCLHRAFYKCCPLCNWIFCPLTVRWVWITKKVTLSTHKGWYLNLVCNKRAIIQNKQDFEKTSPRQVCLLRRWRIALSSFPFFSKRFVVFFCISLRQVIKCYWSVHTLLWLRTATSKPAVTIKQRNEQATKLLRWYPYLCLDSICSLGAGRAADHLHPSDKYIIIRP